MKIKRIDKQKSFQPIELKITIETEREHKSISRFCASPITVAEKITRHDNSIDFEIIRNFLNSILDKVDVD
jgi:hypothetical protein